MKEAVANLTTTTAENWWDREEAAVRERSKTSAATSSEWPGALPSPPVAIDTPATAPFTSRRDAFVTQMKGRVNTFGGRWSTSRRAARARPR